MKELLQKLTAAFGPSGYETKVRELILETIKNDVDDLKAIVAFLKNNRVNFKVLGNGSNLVCGESEYDGVVISLKNICAYESCYIPDGKCCYDFSYTSGCCSG